MQLLKRLLKIIIIIIFKIVSFFFKRNRDLITFIFHGYSGSNILPLIEKLEESNVLETKGYKVKVVDMYELNNELMGNKIRRIFFAFKYSLKSKVIITTHGFFSSVFVKNGKLINLWHGIPLKSMGLMNKTEKDSLEGVQGDYFISTSEFYNTIMNSCVALKSSNYYITGYPRNDYLFKENGNKNLELLINRDLQNKKVVLYAPTYRDVKRNISDLFSSGNVFAFDKFDIASFEDFLKENNLMFLLKLHPIEEKILREQKLYSDNIVLIKNEDLQQSKMDLYKILNAVDLLITDYSSIYFDYLLLDRPIIFVPVDFDLYKETRGFLLEPYDFWTPGPKCLDQNSLQVEIIKNLNNPMYYSESRKVIRDIMHKYQDGNSTDRVIELILSILNKNK